MTSASLRKYLYDHYMNIMSILDQDIRGEMNQYLWSLDKVCHTKNPPVPKKDINIDPLITQIYEDLNKMSAHN